MVVEFLTFRVPPDERAAWMEIEERTWSRFLEQQPGFVRKQLWAERGNDSDVHAVIEWESMEQWQAIPADQLAAVDEAMGTWFRSCTCRVFDVIRDC
jgi:uncharacterized protein (TIGR03792 family)